MPPFSVAATFSNQLNAETESDGISVENRAAAQTFDQPPQMFSQMCSTDMCSLVIAAFGREGAKSWKGYVANDAHGHVHVVATTAANLPVGNSSMAAVSTPKLSTVRTKSVTANTANSRPHWCTPTGAPRKRTR